MAWIIGWCVFMAYGGYIYGNGIGTAIISFVFWFLILMAARTLILNARQRGDHEQRP